MLVKYCKIVLFLIAFFLITSCISPDLILSKRSKFYAKNKQQKDYKQGNWHHNIIATYFGGYRYPNDLTIWGTHLTRENPYYCALPAKKNELKNQWVEVIFHNKKQSVFVQWVDVGPWNIDDFSYVFSNGRTRPQAESGFDKGLYGKPRKTNKAGIDLSLACFNYVGLKPGKHTVNWRFVPYSKVKNGPWKKYISKLPAKY